MFKNTGSQKWTVLAWTAATGVRLTGDAANITAKISIDDSAVGATNDVNPTEVEDGRYTFDLTQAETNGDKLELLPQSATAGVEVIGIPAMVYTRPSNAGNLAIDSNGRVDVSLIEGADATDTINAQADLAISDYDPPTKAEMDSAHSATDTLITTVDTVVDAILVDTAVIGVAGAGLTAVAWNSAWDAEVQSEVADALTAYDPPTKAEMDSAHSTTDTLITTVDTVVDSILADTNELQSDDIPGSLSTISGKIDTVDNFLDTEVSAILADTNELQGDWVNGGRLDLLVDSIITKIDTVDDLLDTEVAAIKTDTAAILADTNELQGDWVNGGRLDLLLDATLADTNELQGDWVNGGRLDLIVDGILVDTAEIGTAGAGLTEAGGTGDQLTAVPWNSAWDAEVQSECADALTAYDPPTKAEMDSAHSTTDALITTVDTVVDAILVDTAVIGTAGAGLTDLGGMSTGMKAEVNTEVDSSVVTYGLDHLVSASVAGSDVTDNSIIAKLVSKESTADWDDFVNTTDSLQAMRDRGDASWITATGFNTSTPPTAAAIVNEWESQSQADPTGFHVNVKEVNGTAQTANDNGADINSILADTNELQGDDIPGSLSTLSGKVDVVDGIADAILVDTGTTLPATLSTIDSEIGTVDTVVDAIKVTTDKMVFTTSNQLDVQVISMATNSLTASAAAADFIGASEIAASASAEIADLIAADWVAGDASPLAIVAALKADSEWSNLATIASALATVDSNVDSILVDTAEIGAAGAGLTAVVWNSSWDAEIQSECNDALVALGLDHLVSASVAGSDIADNSVIAKLVSKSSTADWDDFVNTTDSLQALRDRGDASWVTATGFNTTTPPTVAAIVNEWESQSQADPTGFHVNVMEVNGTAQTANDNGADINAILADTNELQSDDIPGSLSTISGKIDAVDDLVDTEVAAIKTVVDAVLVDTNELQGDWANGGRLDLLLDATLADTNELQGDWTNGGRLDLIVDAILVDTAVIGSAGAGMTAVPWNSAWDAEVQSECADALTAYDPPTKTEMDSAHSTTDALITTVDTVVDSILVDTAEIGTAGAGLSDLGGMSTAMKAEINTECDASMVTYGMDHLISASVADGDVTDNSVFAMIVSKESTAGWDDYEHTTDSLQALRDRGDAAWTTGGGGTAAAIADAVWDEATSGHTTSGTFGEQLKTDVDAILADTNELQSDDIPGSLSTISGKIDTVDDLIDTEVAAINTVVVSNGIKLDTIDNFIDTEVAAIKTAVDSILVDTAVIGALGAGLTAIPWNSAWDSEVQSECTDALNFYDPPTKAEMDSAHSTTDGKIDVVDGIVDNILVDTAEIGAAGAGLTAVAWNSAWDAEVQSEADDALRAIRLNEWVHESMTYATINSTSGLAIMTSRGVGLAFDRTRHSLEGQSTNIESGQAQAGAAGTITLAAGASATNDLYNGSLVMLHSGTGTGQFRYITDYNGATKVASISPNWATNPDATTVFNIIPSSGILTDFTPFVGGSVGGGSLGGSGASSVTMTITEGGNPVTDADVWITNDAAGSNVVAGTLQTNSLGKAIFLLDAGIVYYMWMQKDGANSILGEEFTAVAD